MNEFKANLLSSLEHQKGEFEKRAKAALDASHQSDAENIARAEQLKGIRTEQIEPAMKKIKDYLEEHADYIETP